MTRINIGIPPCDLTDQHLLAEFRELPRILNRVKKLIKEDKGINNIPSSFCLGTGHVKFFYNKLHYLHQRYVDLFRICKERKFKVRVYRNLFYMENVFDEFEDPILKYYNNYTPTPTDIELIKSRIATRILNSKQQPRYYGKSIDKHEYIKNILKFEL